MVTGDTAKSYIVRSQAENGILTLVAVYGPSPISTAGLSVASLSRSPWCTCGVERASALGGAEHIVAIFVMAKVSYRQLEVGIRFGYLARNQRAGEWFAVVGVCLGRRKQIGGDGERMGGPDNGSGSRWDAGWQGSNRAQPLPKGSRWALSAEAAGNGNCNYSQGFFWCGRMGI